MGRNFYQYNLPDKRFEIHDRRVKMISFSAAITEIKQDPAKRMRVVQILREMLVSYKVLQSKGIKVDKLDTVIEYLAENMRNGRGIEE